jgi:hypothetical protein
MQEKLFEPLQAQHDRDDGQTASLAGKLVRDFIYTHYAAKT